MVSDVVSFPHLDLYKAFINPVLDDGHMLHPLLSKLFLQSLCMQIASSLSGTLLTADTSFVWQKVLGDAKECPAATIWGSDEEARTGWSHDVASSCRPADDTT